MPELTFTVKFDALPTISNIASFADELKASLGDMLAEQMSDYGDDDTNFTTTLNHNLGESSSMSKKAGFTVNDFGKKVKIINARCGLAIGTTGIAMPWPGAATMLKLDTNPAYSVYFNEVEVTEDTKESLQKDLGVLEAEIAQIKLKIQYLDKTGSDKFDQNEFKAYSILETLEDGSDNFTKAKKIAELFK